MCVLIAIKSCFSAISLSSLFAFAIFFFNFIFFHSLVIICSCMNLTASFQFAKIFCLFLVTPNMGCFSV